MVFDLDDTLYDNAPVMEHAETALEAWLARHHAPLARAYDRVALRRLRREIAVAEPAIAHDMSALRRRALARAARETGCPEGLAEEGFRVFLEARQRITLFRETLPVLERLARERVVGTFTNGNADARRLPFAHLLGFALSAETAGAAKPDPRAYQAALAAARAEAREVLWVGDDPERDVRGARAAGLHAVWFNPKGRPWEGDGEPPHQVASLGELPALLARRGAP